MKNKTFKYVDKFKYLMLIPIVLLLFAIVFGAIFNLNFDYDFRKISNFSVKFNTTVTETEYDILENEIIEILDENGFKDYRIERVGTGAQNAVFVKIANDDSKLDSKIEDVKLVIEETLLTRADNLTSSVVVSLTDTDYSLPKNVTNMIWFSVLAVACIVVFVFAYTAIRYNLMAGCSLALSIIIEIIMLLSAMITFRIPFNYYFVVPYIVMILTTIINATYINNYLKPTLNDDAYNKYTNSERVEEATLKTYKGINIYSSMLIILVLAVMFFGGPSLIYLGLAIIVGIIISIFVSLLINTTLWSFWYKKDKDKMLKRRIELEKQREENKNKKNNKEDEKIVV
ncbi:MAG: hypothetical protein ACI4PF_06275 [Christensenellales bacterium]